MGTRSGNKRRTGTAPKRRVKTEGEQGSDCRHLDPEVVGARTAEHFGQEYHETEGPAVVGEHRIWRVWTHDGDYYHAHYAVCTPAAELLFFRDFAPFALWLQGMTAETADRARQAGREAAASDRDVEYLSRRDALDNEHKRRVEWVKTLVAAAIVLALLGLVVFQTAVRGAEGFDVSYVVTALLGAGAAYLLGYQLGRRPGGATTGPGPD